MTSTPMVAGTGAPGIQTRIRAGLAALLDWIGPDIKPGPADGADRPASPDWIAGMALLTSVAIMLISAGQGAGLRGESSAPLLFWFGVLLMMLPLAFRISWPRVSRGERLALVLLLTGGLFFYKIVYAPTGFQPYDGYLHWVAADDMMTAHRLFLSNPLLPIGRTYPALEILTTAAANLTGGSLFACAQVLIGVCKLVFIASLFLFYERIGGSPRTAALACLAYMGCTTFVVFEAEFSYESLGIALVLLTYAVESGSRDFAWNDRLGSSAFVVMLLAAIMVTHHLSAAYAAIYFVGIALVETVRRGSAGREKAVLIALAFASVLLPVLWMHLWGNQLNGYLGPVIAESIQSLIDRLHGLAKPAPTTVSAPSQPVLMRLATLASLLLLSIGCATGFFRSLASTAAGGVRGWRAIQEILRRRWSDSRLVFATLLACAFPVSVAFRLTVTGWEMGNRMGTLAMVGAGLVAATGVVAFWEGIWPRGGRRLIPMAALTMIAIGGITAGATDPIRGRYQVGADAGSVEPMAIETALWTKEHLGPGNRFVGDRVGRLLLAGYGRQDVMIDVAEGVSTGRVYSADALPPDDLWSLGTSKVDFMMVDMRLSTAPPLLGYYFDPWERSDDQRLSPRALLKFDDVKGIGRVYDNGWIKIFDVRGLHARF